MEYEMNTGRLHKPLQFPAKIFIYILAIAGVMMVPEIVYYRNYHQPERIINIFNNNNIFNRSSNATSSTSPPIARIILTNEFTGRFGNLMFQIASAYGIAQSNGMEYQVHCKAMFWDLIVPIFEHLGTTLPCIKNWTNFERRVLGRWGTFDPSVLQLAAKRKPGFVLWGHMQSYKYFWHSRNDLKKVFTFRPQVQQNATDHLERILKEQPLRDETTVGVHVRRGDYLSKININFGYIVPAADYFERAFHYFREKYGKIRFIVVSEDLDWCRQVMTGNDTLFTSSGDPLVDMCLLSRLDHIIISVGTYGWMSAFLNQGEVVYFRNLSVSGSVYGRDYTADDYFPPEWLSL